MEGCGCLSRPLELAPKRPRKLRQVRRNLDTHCRNFSGVFLNKFRLVQAVKILTRMILLGMIIIMDAQLDLRIGRILAGQMDHGKVQVYT